MSFTILKEHRPTRCEICHQSDCFDPATEHCSRCDEVSDEAIDSAKTSGDIVVLCLQEPTYPRRFRRSERLGNFWELTIAIHLLAILLSLIYQWENFPFVLASLFIVATCNLISLFYEIKITHRT